MTVSTTLRLYHYPLDPRSRRVRLALAEKGLACEAIIEKPWDPRPDYIELSPAGDVPTVVIDQEDDAPIVLSGATPICEFLEETQTATSLLGKDPTYRAEVRRLILWFEEKMATDVTDYLVGEKAFKRLRGEGGPDSARLRAGLQNIHGHLDYIAWLTQRRNWLAGDQITLADLAAAAQLSCIDYLGDVPWAQHPEAKEWYARIKSRPSFRSLLGDHIPGLVPPRQYADLDF